MTDQPTPRTDNEEVLYGMLVTDPNKVEYRLVRASFARDLEREVLRMREALEQHIWRTRITSPSDPFCSICGAGWKWSRQHGHQESCALYVAPQRPEADRPTVKESFTVAGRCPYPVTGDDGTAADCVRHGHCGCGTGPDRRVAQRRIRPHFDYMGEHIRRSGIDRRRAADAGPNSTAQASQRGTSR